jgi:hypothetical protein
LLDVERMAHQFGSPIGPPSLLIAVAAVMLLHAAATAAESDEETPSCAGSLPATVSVAHDLQRQIGSMLAMSSTFRAQCGRIAQARSLIILIRVDPALLEHRYRARTSFSRTPAGALVARVQISLRTNPVEWIAHELEHVVEQLDGLNLPALATGGQGAWLSAEKMFETMRAIEAGRRVAAEMRQAARRAKRPDIFVE